MRTNESIYTSRKGDHVFGYVCGQNKKYYNGD